MIAELGIFSLILALLTTAYLVCVPCLGLARKQKNLLKTMPIYVVGQFILISFAYLCLMVCFLNDDFSVLYVMANSSVVLPWFYKICAVWGGHEGSILLWLLILSFWTVLVAFSSKHLDEDMRARVLVILGLLIIGFLLFLLTTSNPFLRQFVSLKTTGRDLNPLLQDPGFLFHPPMLYMGYVGFAVAFAFAVAALWAGKIETTWAKWTRPWTLAAWCCLTAGITLGSWWAYRELGWGGWRFWDPVENASFMPWLVGTALIHSLAVTEQRRQFQAWTMLLAITAFSLSLIGTFLVRSGVLTSVHAFAVDPQRGLFILIFLLLVIGGSLLLFVLRAQTLISINNPQLVSRESALLLNNVLLVVIMLSVLMGTLYPLLIDGLGLGKLSVGAPYFNSVFVPLMFPVIFLMGLAVHLKWHQDHLRTLFKKLRWSALLSVLVPMMLWSFSRTTLSINAFLGLALAIWLILSTALGLVNKWRDRGGFLNINCAYYGMVIAHCGVAVAVLGVTISSTYGIQDDVAMSPGSKVTLAGYTVDFVTQQSVNGPNYTSTQAEFKITAGDTSKTIYPEKRMYTIGKMAMTESAIDVNPFRDIYIALGEPLTQQSWSVRLYYKPFIRWIWGGGFLILLGGLLAMSDARYYFRKKSVNEVCA